MDILAKNPSQMLVWQQEMADLIASKKLASRKEKAAIEGEILALRQKMIGAVRISNANNRHLLAPYVDAS